jgi:hypothetical protein
LGNSPIRYTDFLGDTIRLTDDFKNDKNLMEGYNLWKNSRAGKKFIKRYGKGGKYGDVLVVLDKFKEGENKRAESGSTATYVRGNGYKKKLITPEEYNKVSDKYKYTTSLKKDENLMFVLKFESSENFDKLFNIRDKGLTIVHETQHLRIIHYSILMMNKKISTYKQHIIMRTNYRDNGIYDFNAERWQFLNEFRLDGETNSDLDEKVGDFKD